MSEERREDYQNGGRLDQIEEKIDLLYVKVSSLDEAIRGNSKEGLNMQVDRNTRFRKTMSKALWLLLVPLYGGLVALLFAQLGK